MKMNKLVYLYSHRELLLRVLDIFCFEEDNERGCFDLGLCCECLICGLRMSVLGDMTNIELERYVSEVI